MTDSSRWQVFGVVSFYMAAALVMVFVNKAVLNAAPDLPFTFLFNQTAIAVILLHAAAHVSPRVVLPQVNLATVKNLTPVITVGMTGLIFNTLCLRAVDASFFQIARGLILPMTIACSSLTTRERPTAQVYLAAGTVALGFFLGVAPSSLYVSQGTLSTSSMVMGVVYGLLSSILLAVHAVLTKPAHKFVDNSSIKLAYYVNLCGSAMLLPCMLLNGEASQFLEAQDWEVFVFGSVVTGVFGFLLCIAGLLSIKVTSPVTHMFSSAARSVLQTILGAVIFGEVISVNRGVSIGVITLGTLYYTWYKSFASKPALQLPTHNVTEKPTLAVLTVKV